MKILFLLVIELNDLLNHAGYFYSKNFILLGNRSIHHLWSYMENNIWLLSEFSLNNFLLFKIFETFLRMNSTILIPR